MSSVPSWHRRKAFRWYLFIVTQPVSWPVDVDSRASHRLRARLLLLLIINSTAEPIPLGIATDTSPATYHFCLAIPLSHRLRQLTPSPIFRLLTSLVRSCKCLQPKRTRSRRRRHHLHSQQGISANSSGYYNARRARCRCGSPSPSRAARPYARPVYQRPMSGPTSRTQPAKTGGGDCDVPSPAAARSMLWAIAASTLL